MDSSPFTYPAVKLDIYTPNFTGKCAISYYEPEKDIQNSTVYIVDVDRPFEFNLCDEKGAAFTALPSPGEVFLVNLREDGFHRVVRSDDSLFFIDIGYVMEMTSEDDFEFFKLSEQAQQMSARAIRCKVVKMTDEYGYSVSDLDDIFSEQLSFTVVQIERNQLNVALIKLPANNNEKTRLQLTQEQIDILNEEPEQTTNALKAVSGYVPQDEKRICPFYDPATGRCFKGNSCRLEHMAMLPDGTTRDRKPALHKLEIGCVPMIGSKVKVCITCVVSVEEFYVYIPEISARSSCRSLEELKRQINSTDMVNQYGLPLAGIPDLWELVLVRRKNIFYRGKVMECFDGHCVIFFFDYGFTEIVYSKDIFKWHPRWNTEPAQAHRCFMENVRQIDSKQSEAKDAFRIYIRTQTELSAEIIGLNDDLYVRLYDDYGCDIGEMLCAEGFAELKTRLVPTTAQLPG